MCFKIDWASLIVGSKFTVFALFYFVFEGNFPSLGLYLEGLFNGGFFCVTGLGGLYMVGLIFGILRYQDSQSKGGPEALRTAHRIGLKNNR